MPLDDLLAMKRRGRMIVTGLHPKRSKPARLQLVGETPDRWHRPQPQDHSGTLPATRSASPRSESTATGAGVGFGESPSRLSVRSPALPDIGARFAQASIISVEQEAPALIDDLFRVRKIGMLMRQRELRAAAGPAQDSGPTWNTNSARSAGTGDRAFPSLEAVANPRTTGSMPAFRPQVATTRLPTPTYGLRGASLLEACSRRPRHSRARRRSASAAEPARWQRSC